MLQGAYGTVRALLAIIREATMNAKVMSPSIHTRSGVSTLDDPVL